MRQNLIIRKNSLRAKRKLRVRGKISGCQNKPRISIFKSNRYVYAQAIDDVQAVTLASVDGKKEGQKSNIEGAKALGAIMAQALKDKGIEDVVFDKNGYVYHGVVAAFAQSLRDNGIKL